MPTIDEKIEKIKSGNYHTGHLLLDQFMESDPDEIFIIDAGTGESETYGSMLKRVVHLARCLQTLGLQPGDVLALAGRNHINLWIPFYAAMMNGLTVSGLDPKYYEYADIKESMEIIRPRIAFCQQDNYDVYSQVARDLGIDMKIITYDDGETSMAEFMKTVEEKPVEDFQPCIFDTNKVYAWLVSSSGTTGAEKMVAIRHYEAAQQSIELLRVLSHEKSRVLNLGVMHFISSFCTGLGIPLLNWTLVQSSLPITDKHLIDIINEYKPARLMANPALLYFLLRIYNQCDLTCIKSIFYGGYAAYKDLKQQVKQKLHSDVMIREVYGQTEVVSLAMFSQPDTPLGSCGKLCPQFTFKLVDPTTGKVISEPNKRGELWLKGPSFVEYYKNPEETAKTITKDGWIKTGDLFYVDHHRNFYFVERIKVVIKFRNHQVVPLEIEEVIQSHEAVNEVCVTSIPDEVDSEHPVACVVRRPGYQISPEDIKTLVANKLADPMHLRGGVIFMEELIRTSPSACKVARRKMKDFVQQAHKAGLLQ